MELWTRCPSYRPLVRARCNFCAGYPDHGLVPIDGEGAVNRVAQLLAGGDGRTVVEPADKEFASDLLYAVAGE